MIVRKIFRQGGNYYEVYNEEVSQVSGMSVEFADYLISKGYDGDDEYIQLMLEKRRGEA